MKGKFLCFAKAENNKKIAFSIFDEKVSCKCKVETRIMQLTVCHDTLFQIFTFIHFASTLDCEKSKEDKLYCDLVHLH